MFFTFCSNIQYLFWRLLCFKFQKQLRMSRKSYIIIQGFLKSQFLIRFLRFALDYYQRWFYIRCYFLFSRSDVFSDKNNLAFDPYLFSCAFAKLPKTTISFFMSVCPSVCSSVHPHGTTRLSMKGFSWNLICLFFENMSRQFKFH